MTTDQQYTANEVECKAVLVNNEIQIMGTFHFSMSLDPKTNELDTLITNAETIGQMIKERIAIAFAGGIGQTDDKSGITLWGTAAQKKNGRRPFTIIAPFGRIEVQRHRLRNPVTGKPLFPRPNFGPRQSGNTVIFGTTVFIGKGVMTDHSNLTVTDGPQFLFRRAG